MSNMMMCPHCKKLFSREDEKRAISSYNNPEPDFSVDVRFVFKYIAQMGKVYRSELARYLLRDLTEIEKQKIVEAVLDTGEYVNRVDEKGSYLELKRREDS